MNSKVYKQVKSDYAEKRRRAQQTANEHRNEIYELHPEIIVRDSGIFQLLKALLGAGEDTQKILDKIEVLIRERDSMLVAAGYPKDYMTPPYECKLCNDTGYNGTELCPCMKKAMCLESLKESGLGKLANEQSFDNFSLSYYTGASRDSAERNMNALKAFGESFSDDSHDNFLLIGGTGLGKTHLSTSLAKLVIDRGYYVVYTSVINMFDDFEKKRFSSQSYEKNEHLTDRYFECDLLIIDDLGCEMATQFTVSSLYNLLNTRLNDGKCTVINTNLSPEDFQSKYDSRITSRILGNFSPLVFTGSDIRRQKLAGN